MWCIFKSFRNRDTNTPSPRVNLSTYTEPCRSCQADPWAAADLETQTPRASGKSRIKCGAGLKGGWIRKPEVKSSGRSKLCNISKAQDHMRFVGQKRAVHKAGKSEGGGDRETGRRDTRRSPHTLLTLERTNLDIWVMGSPKLGDLGQAWEVRSSSVGFPSILVKESNGHIIASPLTRTLDAQMNSDINMNQPLLLVNFCSSGPHQGIHFPWGSFIMFLSFSYFKWKHLSESCLVGLGDKYFT